MLVAGTPQEPHAKRHCMPSLRRRGGRNAECVRVVIVPAVSTTTILLAGSTLLAFALAAIATPLVGLAARQLGMLDMPGGRRRHPRPTPRPAGLPTPVPFGPPFFAFCPIDRP